MRKPMTQLERHKDKWKDGCGSDLCPDATKIVFTRGKLPCDILFIGEAPGRSEDILGKPFVGPAGHLLDNIISRAIPEDLGVRVAFTNLVCCIPRSEEGGKSTDQPLDEHIKACAPRLCEFVALAKPRVIIAVGKLPEHWLDPGMKDSVGIGREYKRIVITHPAALLRTPVVKRVIDIQRCIVTIRMAVDKWINIEQQ